MSLRCATLRLRSCAVFWTRLVEESRRRVAERQRDRLQRPRLPAEQRDGAVEIDDVDPDRGGQARRGAAVVDVADEPMDRRPEMPRNVVQRVPLRGLQANAGAVSADDDVADHQRRWRAVVGAARPLRELDGHPPSLSDPARITTTNCYHM